MLYRSCIDRAGPHGPCGAKKRTGPHTSWQHFKTPCSCQPYSLSADWYAWLQGCCSAAGLLLKQISNVHEEVYCMHVVYADSRFRIYIVEKSIPLHACRRQAELFWQTTLANHFRVSGFVVSWRCHYRIQACCCATTSRAMACSAEAIWERVGGERFCCTFHNRWGRSQLERARSLQRHNGTSRVCIR